MSGGAGMAKVWVQGLIGRVNTERIEPYDHSGVWASLLDLLGCDQPRLLFVNVRRDVAACFVCLSVYGRNITCCSNYS